MFRKAPTCYIAAMTDDQFERLAQLIKSSHDDLSERMDKFDVRMDKFDSRFNSVDTRFENLETRMVEGFSAIQADLRAIRQELANIEMRLTRVEQRAESNAGFAKEIDDLRRDITLIKHKLQLA